MSRWFRHYAGMCRDEKLVRVALRSKQPIERVVWIYSAILESATEIDNGGLFEVDVPEIAYFLRANEADVQSVIDALEAMGRITAGAVAKWGDRQFQSDRSTERQRLHREKKRAGDGPVLPERTPEAVTKTSGDGLVTTLSRHGDSPETETETEAETEEAAPAASSADAAKIDLKEIERRCVQATGWHSTQGFSAITDLIAEGFDFEGRILPMLRSVSAELKGRGKPAPDRWAFVLKTVRDATRRPTAQAKPIEMVWILEGSAAWEALIASGKRESYLRSMMKTDGAGREGIWWEASRIPRSKLGLKPAETQEEQQGETRAA